MSLFHVELTGASAPYEVYGGIAACGDYLLAASGAGAKKYRALPAGGDSRDRLLIGGTRWVDDLLAGGVPTHAGGTTLRVPMEDVVNADGSPMSDADQLALAARAAFEGAALLAADQDAAAAVDTGSNLRKLDAQGTSIEFFRPTSAADGTASRIPGVLERILRPLLDAAAGGAAAQVGSAAGASYGTCGDSVFEERDRYVRTGPL